MDNLNQNSLDSLLGNPVQLIPESLITTITIGFIVLNLLGLAFIVLYIIGLVRKWKVESAVLHMQKDLAEIKTQLAEQRSVLSPSQPESRSVEPIDQTTSTL